MRLCGGVTDAPLTTTTEVYPDSPSTSPDECNRAQVACISAALSHIRMSAEAADEPTDTGQKPPL